jgi:hypothetical protein
LHVKVVTENGSSTCSASSRKAKRTRRAEVARTTGGVRKVVKVFDYCKPTEAICARGGKAEEPKKSRVLAWRNSKEK